MSHNKSAIPAISLTPTDGGSNMGLYIGLGVFALLAAGGVGYYMYSSGKKKEEAAKKKAAAAAADADKVPLIINGKPVTGKDGKPVMVDPSVVQAGKPVVGVDGQPVTGSDGKPVVPSAADVKAVAAAADSTGGGSGSGAGTGGTTTPDTSGGGAKSNDYVQGATIDKRNGNSDFKPYDANSPDEQGFKQSISDLFDLSPKIKNIWTKKHKKRVTNDANNKLADTETYVRGFLKGLNLALRADYVGIFGQQLQDYMNNPAKMKEKLVDTGFFLKTK